MSAPLGSPRETNPQTVRLSVDELVERALAQRGTTVSAAARARAATARREAAEAEARIPAFMVGLGYWQDPHMRAGFGANVSMTLPWLSGTGRERVSEAHELELAARDTGDATLIEARMEIGDAHAQLRAAEQQLVSVHTLAVPAARRAIEAVQTGYATGRSSLVEWVDAARSLLDLETEEADLDATLALAVATLEQAVGIELAREDVTLEKSP